MLYNLAFGNMSLINAAACEQYRKRASKTLKVSVYMIKSYYYDDVSDLREFSTSDKKKIIKLFYLVAAS